LKPGKSPREDVANSRTNEERNGQKKTKGTLKKEVAGLDCSCTVRKENKEKKKGGGANLACQMAAIMQNNCKERTESKGNLT